jgi:hypothetical protein
MRAKERPGWEQPPPFRVLPHSAALLPAGTSEIPVTTYVGGGKTWAGVDLLFRQLTMWTLESRLSGHRGQASPFGLRAWVEEGRGILPGLTNPRVPVLLAADRAHAIFFKKPPPAQDELRLVDELHILTERTARSLGALPLEAHAAEGLTLEASKLNESVALFRSLDGLYAQLDAVSCRLYGADEVLPPAPPRPEPLSIACGVRRLSVPLVPRAPGWPVPVFELVMRDRRSGAPTGGAVAA